MIKDNIQRAILKLFSEGYKQKYISSVLDVSINTIRTIITKQSVQYEGIENRKKSYTSKILKLYTEGHNKMSICSTLNLNSKTVKDVLVAEGAFMDKKTQEEEIIKLYLDGYNSTSIANYLRIAYKTVIKVLKDNNYDVSKNTYSDKKLVDRSRNNILNLYQEENLSVKDICKKLDLKELVVLHDINL